MNLILTIIISLASAIAITFCIDTFTQFLHHEA